MTLRHRLLPRHDSGEEDFNWIKPFGGAPLAEFEALIASLIAHMLPYSIGFKVVSTIVFLLWLLLGLPLGSGAELYYVG